MKQGMSEKELTELLFFVNELRQTIGLQPIPKIKKGEAGSEAYCPLASSLNSRILVGGRTITVLRKVDAVKVAKLLETKLPESERGYDFHLKGRRGQLFDKFVDRFDSGDTRLTDTFDTNFVPKRDEDEEVVGADAL